MTEFDAGSVFTGLAFDVDAAGAHRYEKLIEDARRQREVDTKLGFEVDQRKLDEYEREIKKIQAREIETKVGLDVKRLRADAAEADRIVKDYERKREQAAQGEAVSAAAYLREARKRQAAEQQKLATAEKSLGVVKAEQAALRQSEQLSRASARVERERERTIARVTRAQDDNTRSLTRQTAAMGGGERAARRLGRAVDSFIPGLTFGTRIPVYKFVAIGTAIASIIAPATALAGALGPVVGLLGALPTVAATGIGALTTGLLGMRGISDAVGSAWDQQIRSGQDAIDVGQKAAANAEQIRSAEESLTDATRSERDARDQLNDSIEDATRRYEDMRLAVRRARDEEDDSTRSLREAREELARLQATGGTSDEIAEARERVSDAELSLTEARLQSSRATKDFNEVERQGVRNMDEVVASRRALADASRGVARATEDVAQATHDAAVSMSEGQSSAKAFERDMENLSPAGRRFVRLIQTEFFPMFKRLRNEAQEGLLPGLGGGLQSASRNFPVLERMVSRYAKALGDAAEQQGKLLGDKQTGRDLNAIFGQGEELIQKSADAAINWEQALIDVGVAADPLVDWLGDMNVELSEMFEKWAEDGRESGSLERFFRRTIDTVETVVGALWDFGRGLINIGSIARRTWGHDLLHGIEDVAEKFREWTESVKGQRDIEDYFRRWRRRWHEISVAVKEVFDRYRELRREGEKPFDALTEALAEAFSRALPKIVNNVGRMVPNIVEAFVVGFIHADWFGRALTAGLLITKFGGAAAWVAIGKRLGGFLGIGIASGATAAVETGAVAAGGAAGAGAVGAGTAAAGGAAGGGLVARLAAGLGKVPKVGLIGAGIVWADAMFNSFEERAKERSKNVVEQLESIAHVGFFEGGAIEGVLGESDTTKDAKDLAKAVKDLATHSREITPKRAAELRKELSLLFEVTPGARREINRLVDVAEDRFKDGRDATKDWRIAIGTMVRDSQGKFANMRTNVQFNTRLIKEALRDESGAGRDALAKNVSGIVDVIRRTMRRSGHVTDAGLALIKKMYINELMFYGLDEKHAVAGANVRQGNVAGGFRRQDPVLNPTDGRAGGGFFGRMGEKGRDLVHAVVGRGEAILNHVQQRIVNSSLARDGIPGLPGLFAMTAGSKHYMASGGFLAPVPGEPGTTVDRRILNDAIRLRRRYRLGYGDGYAPTGHAAGGEHPLGLAIDMFPGARGSWNLVDQLAHWAEPSQDSPRDPFRWVGYDGDVNHGRGNHLHLSWLHGPGMPAAWVKTLEGKVLGGLSARLKRVIIRGTPSPLLSTMQANVDRVRHQAQRRLDRRIGTPVGGFEGLEGVHYSGPLDRAFPMGSNIQLSRRQVHGLHRKAGLPDVFDDISWRESRNMPGAVGHDPGGTIGEGLHQITFGVQSTETAALLRALGNSFNPWDNSVMARWMYNKSGTGPWDASGPYAGGGFAGIANPLVGGGGESISGGLGVQGWVGGSGLMTGTGRSGTKRSNRVVDRMTRDIDRLGDRYDLANRRFELSDEEFIIEGDEDTPPSLDQAAIAKRLEELEMLLAIRNQIRRKYQRMILYMRRLMRVYRQMRTRLAKSINATEGALNALKGKKGKEAARSRRTLNKRLDEYRGAYGGAGTQLDELGPAFYQAGQDLQSTEIDIEELQLEAGPLRGGGAGLTLPDFEPSSADDSDLRAQLDQAERRALGLQTALDITSGAFRTWAGPGDIGAGGPTAFEAVMNPMGRPGQGPGPGIPLTTLPDGSVVPTSGPGVPGTLGALTILGDAATLDTLASHTVRGMGRQPHRQSTFRRVNA